MPAVFWIDFASLNHAGATRFFFDFTCDFLDIGYLKCLFVSQVAQQQQAVAK